MYDPLGLSIGSSNLVAARNGSPPVTRRAVLTLYPHRASEIGLPEESSKLTESGTVTAGFVDCIGGSGAMFSADGETQDPELLLVEALDAMISAAGGDTASSDITIAVPAHWGPEPLRGLRKGLRTHAGFVRSGTTPRLVSDALAALTAVNATSGLPNRGVLGLLDFGGAGTSITLSDAGSSFEPIGKTLRYTEFSGNQIDEALLLQVADATGRSNLVDSAATPASGTFTRQRERCRQAKERLSTEILTDLTIDSSSHRSTMQITRAELEELIAERLSGVFSAFDDMLAQQKLRCGDLAAVVAVGGGANIPFVTQQLSSHTRTSVITVKQPGFSAAVGAAMFASREPAVIEETTAATALAAAATGTNATQISGLPPADLFLDEEPPSPPPKLAWSEDDGTGMEPVFYDGDIYSGAGGVVRPVRYASDYEPPEETPRGRYRVPRLILGLSALAAMMAVGGVAYNLTSSVAPSTPTQSPSKPVAPPPPSGSIAPSPSVVPPPPSVVPNVSSPELAPPPPPESSPEPPPPSAEPSPQPPPPPPPPAVTTTYQPPPSATTTQPATTPPTTTTTPTTTTEPPPNTPTDTSTSVPMTTEYLTLPLVPVPIPIQVPQNQASNAPQNPFVNPPQNPYVNPPQNPYLNPPGY